MVILSVTGLFKMVFILIGVFVLMRFIGRLMIAKRNLDEHEKLAQQQRESEQLLEKSRKNHGKSFISKIGSNERNRNDYVDFEEIEED